MRHDRKAKSLFLSITLALTALLAAPPLSARAEPQVVRLSPDHYTGTWLEIARRPMWLTDGCVAGYTTYRPGLTERRVMVEDGCRMGTPKGELKTIRGIGTLQDAETTRAKLKVRYAFLISMDYWVLYKSPDRSWFISADPEMKNLWIYARHVPSRQQLAKMTAKAAELGYDVRQLEFPEQ